jgi:hypothetical protein
MIILDPVLASFVQIGQEMKNLLLSPDRSPVISPLKVQQVRILSTSIFGRIHFGQFFSI